MMSAVPSAHLFIRQMQFMFTGSIAVHSGSRCRRRRSGQPCRAVLLVTAWVPHAVIADSAISDTLYQLGQQSNALVSSQLTGEKLQESGEPMCRRRIRLAALWHQRTTMLPLADVERNSCRRDAGHVSRDIRSRPADQPVAVHAVCASAHHWLHWWVQRARQQWCQAAVSGTQVRYSIVSTYSLHISTEHQSLMGASQLHKCVRSQPCSRFGRIKFRIFWSIKSPHQIRCACRAAAFALGLASTLAVLGVVSTSLGRTYGSIGSGLPIGTSLCLPSMGNKKGGFLAI